MSDSQIRKDTIEGGRDTPHVGTQMAGWAPGLSLEVGWVGFSHSSCEAVRMNWLPVS